MYKANISNQPGKAFFIVGGQYGSESKGSAACWLIESGSMEFDAYSCSNGAQAGHTAYVNGEKIVTFHLPTAAVVDYKLTGKAKPTFLSAGAVIDLDMFEREVEQHFDPGYLFIHPMASIITDDCKAASREPGSASEKRSGVQKGVGQAIARRALRTGLVARDEPRLAKYMGGYSVDDRWLATRWLQSGFRVLVEIPQGSSLSLSHSGFYPYTTSRDCTVMTAMNDAAIHPKCYGGTMVVLRTRPIRVGNIEKDGRRVGYSGDVYSDQHELTWDELGVEAEITTVSKRIRRVFTFSEQQLQETVMLTKPDVIFLTFCNYTTLAQLNAITQAIFKHTARPMSLVFQWGPTSNDVGNYEKAVKHVKGG